MPASVFELSHERHRLAALHRYDVLDTPPEEAFDRISRLAQRLFAVPMAAVVFIDERRQWFKSRRGIAATELARGPHFCNYTLEAPEALIIPDTRADSRFRDNPLVIGQPGIRFYAGIPLRTPDDLSIGTLCVMDTSPREVTSSDIDTLVDLAALVMTVLALRLHASTDALTGAMSRRAFRSEAERAILLARSGGHDLACLMIDLDHFKAINDGHGHSTGDQVLRACAEICRSELGASDLIGRLGGEEFAVLLPGADAARAKLIAERVRAAIAAARIRGRRGPLSITASLGIATLDGAASGLDALLARADAALYRAKQEGRNRSRVWVDRASDDGVADRAA